MSHCPPGSASLRRDTGRFDLSTLAAARPATHIYLAGVTQGWESPGICRQLRSMAGEPPRAARATAQRGTGAVDDFGCVLHMA